MSEKKIWRIDENWQTSSLKCDGTYCDDIDSEVMIDMVEATEDEIKELIENDDWNPANITNEYGERFRAIEAYEILPWTLDEFKKKIEALRTNQS